MSVRPLRMVSGTPLVCCSFRKLPNRVADARKAWSHNRGLEPDSRLTPTGQPGSPLTYVCAVRLKVDGTESEGANGTPSPATS